MEEFHKVLDVTKTKVDTILTYAKNILDVVFGSLWAILLTVPHPLVLTLLFKKSVLLVSRADPSKKWSQAASSFY